MLFSVELKVFIPIEAVFLDIYGYLIIVNILQQHKTLKKKNKYMLQILLMVSLMFTPNFNPTQ